MLFRLTVLILTLTGLASNARSEELEADLLIVGATESGWAAAIQAARSGVESIVLVHDGQWFGGQYTEQALACVDENKGNGKVGWGPAWHPMKRSFNRYGLFRELMDGIETLNAEKYGSRMPGKPWHGPSTFRPAEAESVFREMIQPWIDSGTVRFFPDLYPVSAEVDDSGKRPRLQSVSFEPVSNAVEGTAPIKVRAAQTIDASDWGEVIQVAGAAWEAGPDPKSRYGEPGAPEDLAEFPPNEMNPITWAMIVEEAEAPSPIPMPANYDERNYPRVSKLSMEAFGKPLEWDRPIKRYGSIQHWPKDGEESERQLSVYSVRRIAEGSTSKDGRTSILLNYMNGQDYPLERLPQRVVDALEATEPGASQKNIVAMTREQREIIFADARQHALGVLHHLQTFVHDAAEDQANSFRNFRLSPEFGTEDKLPPKPYIRESLRLKALYMMREQDARNRDGETKDEAREGFAHVIYPDGVFAWQFHYDFHRTGRAYLTEEGEDGPWIDYEKPGRHTRSLSDRAVFPLRSLVPVEMYGLIGAQKNVGYSSIVSAAIRLHDQCVAIGQAAGATAAVALQTNSQPREIAMQRDLLEAVRDELCGPDTEVPVLLWPWRDMPPSDPAFVPANRLAMLGVLPIGRREVDFIPTSRPDPAWIAETLDRAKALAPELNYNPGRLRLTKGQFCATLWAALQKHSLKPFPRETPTDADADGIPDLNDPLPWTPNDPIIFAIDPIEAGPDEDGVPPPRMYPGELINFTGPGLDSPEDVRIDLGEAWSEDRGYGWSRDISANHRVRNVRPDTLADTFIFTRETDTWEYAARRGFYLVTVCVGDADHEQTGQNVFIEGRPGIKNVKTRKGYYHEFTTRVRIADGKLTIQIGSGEEGANTCLNWVQISRLR